MSKWPCPECSKAFSRKGDLTRHSLLHTGYKPHECSECGKTFAQYSGMKTHMNVHTRAKPYRCGMSPCRAAFGDPSSRARHRKETHSLAGVYQCPESRCKSSIKRRSVFTAHLRKHGSKYAGVDIGDFFVTSPPRSTEAEYVMDLTIPELTTYDTHPAYPSYAAEDMSASPNDYPHDGDLHLATGDLFTFDSRDSSLSPPSLTSASSPSPSPLDFQDERPTITLPYVNIAQANAVPDPGMSGAFPVLSPVSQLMVNCGYDGYNVSEFNKQPMEWA
ncbi:hypothetical protein DFH07DRAFT_303059 [Mycena maculata]|uniref:C2H2-type domain-containing protein n=1 Tax=Mycena maculata TaxID=230809 RepID=A0AAD7ML37_9AGAR|nr:hypothetical protein DFH07DRAFT_303059 [Mycena maculata]